MADERQVAGLWCSEVLAMLSEYVDKGLPAETVAQIEAHLADCDWCLNFGGQFSSVISELTKQLAAPDPLTESTAQRLRDYVRKRIAQS